MKNKILTILLSSAMLLSTSAVFADTPKSADITERTMLVVYDNNGYILAINTPENVQLLNDTYYVTSKITADNVKYKLVLCDSGKIVTNVAVSSEYAGTSQTPTPAPTPTAAPNENPSYPSVYPSQKDAVFALALVKEVHTTLDENGDEIIKIDCFYQGSERQLLIDTDVRLTNGNELTTLKKGDMIHFSAKLSGEINTVSLDFRPNSKDIVPNMSIPTFQALLSNSKAPDYKTELGKKSTGYVFGIIQDTQKSSLTMYNIDGLAQNSVDLSYSKDTVVYLCDMDNKADVSITGTGDIRKSSIVKSTYDDDDNITVWDKENSYVYALANVIDGDIVEMIIYTY